MRSTVLRAAIRGTGVVSVGVATLGVSSYAYLALGAHHLAPERFAALSVLYVLVNTTGPGLFVPLEQELGRLITLRRAAGEPSGAVVSAAARITVAAAAVLIVGVLAAGRPLRDALLGGDEVLILCLCAGIAAYAWTYLTRGVYAGRSDYRRFGVQIALEGVVRLVLCVALAATGSSSLGLWALAFVSAPVGAVLLTRGTGPREAPGEPAHWPDVSASLGWLVICSACSQVLANAGPVIVALLARDSEQAVAGRFLAAMVVVRVPVFLFASTQAALVPSLTTLSTAGRAEYARTLRRVAAALLVGAALIVGLAVVAGRPALVHLFGSAYAVPRSDVTLLAVGGAEFLAANVLGQALIARGDHARAALAWLVVLPAIAAGILLGSGVVRQAELGLILGGAVVCVAQGAQLGAVLHSRGRARPVA